MGKKGHDYIWSIREFIIDALLYSEYSNEDAPELEKQLGFHIYRWNIERMHTGDSDLNRGEINAQERYAGQVLPAFACLLARSKGLIEEKIKAVVCGAMSIKCGEKNVLIDGDVVNVGGKDFSITAICKAIKQYMESSGKYMESSGQWEEFQKSVMGEKEDIKGDSPFFYHVDCHLSKIVKLLNETTSIDMEELQVLLAEFKKVKYRRRPKIWHEYKPAELSRTLPLTPIEYLFILCGKNPAEVMNPDIKFDKDNSDFNHYRDSLLGELQVCAELKEKLSGRSSPRGWAARARSSWAWSGSGASQDRASEMLPFEAGRSAD